MTTTPTVVLGGRGFLGTALVRRLEAEGHEVIVVDRAGAAPLSFDITDGGLAGLFAERRPGLVFHLATAAFVPPSFDDPFDDLRQNAVTTLAVLEAARGLPNPPRVVIASSAAVYGEALTTPMGEDHQLRPLSPYGASKLVAEHYARIYSLTHSVPTAVCRLFSLYGPGLRKQVVYDLIRRASQGQRPLRILGTPDVTRDLVYVDDAAASLLAVALAAPATGEAYNIAGGVGVRLDDLATSILTALDLPHEVEFTGSVRPGDPIHWIGDGSAAKALGATFDTSLAAGLTATVAWYRDSGE